MLALGVPSSSFSRMVPAVAVYLISFPSIFNECFVCTTFSSGIGGFFSSFGFSAGFSGAGCGGCCAKEQLAPKKSDAAKLRKRCEHFMGGSSPYLQETTIGDVRHRMREHGHRQSVQSAARGAYGPRFLLQHVKSRLECGPRKKLISRSAEMRRAGRSAAIPLLLAAALALAPSRSAAQQNKEDLPHPKTVEELQKAMKDVLDKEHVPGAGVALVANGQLLWCGGIGKADVATGREMSCDTEFRVGSISKTFVALALLKLQEEGKINLYARLQDVAPEIPVKNKWEATQPVRIVNLLEHTAGFDDMEPSEVYNRKDRYDFPLLDVFKRFRKPQVTRWPPGTRMSYSNPGNAIAGYLIEKASGQPFDLYIRETFLRPLGMEKADFPFTDAIKPLMATGYEKSPPRAVGYPFIYLRPAGDLKSFAGRFGKAGAIPFATRESWGNAVGENGIDLEDGSARNDSGCEEWAPARLRPGELLERSRRSRHAWPRWRDRWLHLLVSLHAGAQLGLRRATEQHEFGPRSGGAESPGDRFPFERFSQAAAGSDQSCSEGAAEICWILRF